MIEFGIIIIGFLIILLTLWHPQKNDTPLGLAYVLLLISLLLVGDHIISGRFDVWTIAFIMLFGLSITSCWAALHNRKHKK